MNKATISGFGRIGPKALYSYLIDTPDNVEIAHCNDPDPTEELAHPIRYNYTDAEFEQETTTGAVSGTRTGSGGW